MASENEQLVRDSYTAFATGDRERIEALLADDFTMSTPADPQLDRDGYFERCWLPGATTIKLDRYERIVEHGDEVLVTYEAIRADGVRIRNTEVHTLRDGRIVRQEVYWGWEVE